MSPIVGSPACPRTASSSWCWAGVSPAARGLVLGPVQEPAERVAEPEQLGVVVVGRARLSSSYIVPRYVLP